MHNECDIKRCLRPLRCSASIPLAFSLVEVVLALGIVSFASMAILGLIPVGLTNFRQSMNTTVQAQIAQKLINDAQLTSYDKLINFRTNFDEAGNGVAASDTTKLYAVTVQVTNLSGSLTTNFSSSVATNLVVQIVNISRPRETNTFYSVLVRNE